MSLQNVQHVITKCGKITTVRPHLCAKNRFRKSVPQCNLTVFSWSHRAKAPIKFCLASLGTTSVASLAKEKNLFFLLSRNVGTSVLLFDPYLSSPRRGKKNRYFGFFWSQNTNLRKNRDGGDRSKREEKICAVIF